MGVKIVKMVANRTKHHICLEVDREDVHTKFCHERLICASFEQTERLIWCDS